MEQPKYSESFLRRYWSKVEKTPGCWWWQGTVSGPPNDKYGEIRLGPASAGKEKAHRVAYELAFGPVPLGMMVCHKCDERLCVNPDCLFPGTAKDNNQDKARKGRAPKGENHPLFRHPERRARGEQHGMTSLLTAEVEEIRRIYGPFEPGRKRQRKRTGEASQAALAKRFKVCQLTISNIVTYKTRAQG